MDPKQITSLANLLRDSGDKVLNSEFKLTLSGPLLRALNDSFTLIADQAELCSPLSFQVVKPNNSKSDVFRDLQLVHDFVQKTLLLCITCFPGDDLFEGTIDISKFRSLRTLEIQKTNIKQVVGIQPLRAQLQHLICVRSLKSVEDVITYCGGDNSNGFVWNELKAADFSYNNLRTVDSSLEFAQWLQTLNLSHNQLTSVEAIKWLPNLKMLDLSFNRLTNIPTFHLEASRRLQMINLSNNFIEDLTGISRLDALTELDLSNNCLLDHTYLLPLSTLVTLKYLNLYGNPLYCHPNHRQATSYYLHKNTVSVKFVLDATPLSKMEKSLIGNYQNHCMVTSRLSLGIRSSGQVTPQKRSQGQTPESSVGSMRSFKLNENETSMGTVTNANEMTSSMSEKQKKLRVRTIDLEYNGSRLRKSKSRSAIEASTDHLETKKQIEDLREKFGAGWLHSDHSHMVKSVIGLNEEDDESKDSKMTSKQLIDDLLGQMSNTQKELEVTEVPMMTSTPNLENENQLEASFEDRNTSKEEKFSDDTLYKSLSDGNNTMYTSVEGETSVLNDIYHPSVYEEPEISEPEDNESTYIVYGTDQNDELLLTVSDTSIKEKEVLTRRTRTKWSLKILQSCDRIKANTLRINFDTVKKDKRERVYTVEEGLCQDLENYLRGILSTRLLSEMNQTVYRCVNCSCQFSRENTYKKNLNIICPECKSAYVVEVHESLSQVSTEYGKEQSSKEKLPAIEAAQTSINISGAMQQAVQGIIQNSGEKYLIERSASHGSIGSAGSLNESSSCSKISNSQSSFDSNQSVAGSSTNERDLDFGKNYESDVEILSNPSQSSIEVLDNMHSSRKTSEERRVLQIPSLETIDDRSINNSFYGLQFACKETSTDDATVEATEKGNPGLLDMESNQLSKKNSIGDLNGKKNLFGNVNLTESSSSGSVTDSICTAYEQTDKGSASDATLSNSGVELKLAGTKTTAEKENKKDESIISSMLGGLFQSTNILMSRSQKSTIDTNADKCEKFKFNYEDFGEVDHRLKLFFYQTKFDDPNEHFKWLVKGKIFNETTSELFEGIIVMSTTKLYLMEIFGNENDDIAKWLRQVISVKVDRIGNIQLLPWHIGLAFQISNWGSFLLILQDILRTDSLLLFFANNPLPANCILEYQMSEKVLKKLSFCTDAEQLKMFSLLNKCEILTSDNSERSYSPTGFFTTDTRLYLTTPNMSWLSCNSNANIELGLTQMMSNLVEVDRPSTNAFSINFLDETQDKSELWKCTFETRENAESCLNAIGQSWEKLFGVPLGCN